MSNGAPFPDLVTMAHELYPFLERGMRLLADVARTTARAYDKHLAHGMLDPVRASSVQQARDKLMRVAEVYDDLHYRLTMSQFPLLRENSIELFVPVLKDFCEVHETSPVRFTGTGGGSGRLFQQLGSFARALENLESQSNGPPN